MRQVSLPAVKEQRHLEGGMGDGTNALAVVAPVLPVHLQIESLFVVADMTDAGNQARRDQLPDRLRERVHSRRTDLQSRCIGGSLARYGREGLMACLK